MSEVRELAEKIRNDIIAGSAPYWHLSGVLPDSTAAEVRAEVDPVLKAVIHACSDVIGDGFYPQIDSDVLLVEPVLRCEAGYECASRPSECPHKKETLYRRLSPESEKS